MRFFFLVASKHTQDQDYRRGMATLDGSRRLRVEPIRRCKFCISELSETRSVDDQDVLNVFQQVDDSIKPGDPFCETCVNQARKQLDTVQRQNTSKSTLRSSLTSGFLSSQSQTLSQPPLDRSGLNDSRPTIMHNSQPSACTVPRIKPMPRSKKAAKLLHTLQAREALSDILSVSRSSSSSSISDLSVLDILNEQHEEQLAAANGKSSAFIS